MLAKQKVRPLLKRVVYVAALFMVAWISARVVRTQETPAEGVGLKTYAEIKQVPDGKGGTIDLVEQNNKVFKRERPHLGNMRTAGKAANPEEEKLWDEYYKFRIAEMTWSENLDSLPTKRNDFKKDLRQCVLNANGIVELHTRLNNQLLQTLPVLIANGAYSPITRVNWTLMLGDINEKESKGFGPEAVAAVPHSGALAPLTSLFADPKISDEVRAVAIVGIFRQIQNPSKDQKKDDLKKTIDALRGVVNVQADAKVKDRPGIIWLRRQSCMALGYLALSKLDEVRSAANTADVVKDVHELVRDQAADLNTRCRAAYTLGTLQSRDFPNKFVRTATQSIADLAVAISKPNGKTAPELAFMLTCLQTALQGAEVNRGIASLAEIEKDSQELVKALQGKIDATLKVLSNPNVPEEQLAEAMKAMADELEKLMPPGSGGNAPIPPAAAAPVKPGSGVNTPTAPAAAAPVKTAPPATAGSRVGAPRQPTGTVGVKE